MFFQLDQLLVQHDLQELVTPFTIQELYAIAKELPKDKAPGPDGFNGLFFQKILVTDQV